MRQHTAPRSLAATRSVGTQPTKVLLIAGTGRSGSTLLANVLGQIPGYFCAGELRFIWERGLAENRLCGCGERFRECPLWLAVLKESIGGLDRAETSALHGLRVGGRVRDVPRMIAGRRRARQVAETMPGYDSLSSLFGAIATVSGADIVVDSSKLPAYGYMLDANPSIDLRVVQLIRDPRAAAYSWLRRKVQPDRESFGYMERFSPLKSALLWNLWNRTSEALWMRAEGRYVLIRYEDFIERPADAVTRILDMMGDVGRDVGFLEQGTVDLRPTHSVSGNPSRLRSGPIELRNDSEWTRNLRRRDRALVTAITAPFLRRYGYPIKGVNG